MSETPEIIEAEIAALQEKLAEAQHATVPVIVAEAPPEHPGDEAVPPPESTEIIAGVVAEVAVVPAPVSIPAPSHVAPHAAQTIPARWALQPLER